MKIIVCILSILISSLTSLQAQQWFSSNELGMKLYTIEWFRTDEYEYTLKYFLKDGHKYNVLYKDEKEIKKTIIKDLPEGGKEETIFEMDELIRRIIYDSKGAVQTEYIDSIDGMMRIEYTYNDNQLTERRAYENDNQLLFHDVYTYGRNNKLLRVKRLHGDKTETATWSFNNGGMISETFSSDEVFYKYLYKPNAEIAERVEGYNDSFSQNEKHVYSDDGVLQKVVITNSANNIKTTHHYNQDGIITAKVTRDGDGRITSETNWEYEDGVLIREIRREKGNKTEVNYFYEDDNKTPAREEVIENGTVTQITVYTGEDAWYREIYRKGKPFVRIYYENQEIIKEEFLYDTQ